MGPGLLGEYLLVRRMASWLQAVVVLPSGIALPRYVAASAGQPASTRQAYFVGAAVTACGLALLLTLILVVWRSSISRVIFGRAELAPLALPLGLLLVGLGAQGAVFGFYQGILSMGRACGVQFLTLALFPLLAIAVFCREHSIPLIIQATGLSMIVCAVFFSMSILHGANLAEVGLRAFRRVSELLSFGLSRTWGDFGLQALLSLPAVIAAHYLPMKSVSFLLLGGSFLALVAAATLPLGIILLSQVTRSLAQQRTAQIASQLGHFVDALMESSVFISIQVAVFAGAILRIWVGPDFEAATRIVQLLILAVPFYFVYGGLRSVIDAAAIKAHNTRNILISLAAFFASVTFVRLSLSRGFLLEGLAVSVVAAMAVLSWLTLRTMQELFQLRVGWGRLLPGIGLAALLGACSFVLQCVFHFQPNAGELLLYEVAASGVYFMVLWMFNSPWLHFLIRTMFLFHSSHLQSSE